MAVPACCRIWPRVRLAVSDAKSVSTMRLRDDDRFSVVDARLEIADEKRDCKAPYWARWLLTVDRAASVIFSASCAPSKVVTSISATDLSFDAGPAAAVSKPEPVSLTEKLLSESYVMVPLATAVLPAAAKAVVKLPLALYVLTFSAGPVVAVAVSLMLISEPFALLSLIPPLVASNWAVTPVLADCALMALMPAAKSVAELPVPTENETVTGSAAALSELIWSE